MSESVAVIGVGMMGPGIAARAALAGHPAVLVGRTGQKAAAGVEKAVSCIEQLKRYGLVDGDEGDRAVARLRPETDLARAVRGAFLVVEAISERVAEKRDLFAQLDELADPDVIIASNTSGLRITDISSSVRYPERTATTHFWYPAHLVPLVEVVMGEKTSEETASQLKEMLTKWGKAPVIVKRDLPGQLANRILQAIIREAVNIVEIGLAQPEDVDTAIKMGMALRFPVWGPLEHIDAVGLDLATSVQRDVLPSLCNATQPSAYLDALCGSGSLGYKSGKGMYDWTVKDMKALSERRDSFIARTLSVLSVMEDEETNA